MTPEQIVEIACEVRAFYYDRLCATNGDEEWLYKKHATQALIDVFERLANKTPRRTYYRDKLKAAGGAGKVIQLYTSDIANLLDGMLSPAEKEEMLKAVLAQINSRKKLAEDLFMPIP